MRQTSLCVRDLLAKITSSKGTPCFLVSELGEIVFAANSLEEEQKAAEEALINTLAEGRDGESIAMAYCWLRKISEELHPVPALEKFAANPANSVILKLAQQTYADAMGR
jgi:hypothetical protein